MPSWREDVAMNSLTEVTPAVSSVSRGRLLQGLFKICYLTAVVVSMVGWLSAFGWLTIKVTKWLLA
jgi:hypothetical protein